MSAGIKKRLHSKINSSRGETIAETLVSLLIIVLAMLMLSGSIVSAEKVNKKVKDAETAFNTVNPVNSEEVTGPVKQSVTIKHGTSSSADTSIEVNVFTTKDDNAYVFYVGE